MRGAEIIAYVGASQSVVIALQLTLMNAETNHKYIVGKFFKT